MLAKVIVYFFLAASAFGRPQLQTYFPYLHYGYSPLAPAFHRNRVFHTFSVPVINANQQLQDVHVEEPISSNAEKLRTDSVNPEDGDIGSPAIVPHSFVVPSRVPTPLVPTPVAQTLRAVPLPVEQTVKAHIAPAFVPVQPVQVLHNYHAQTGRGGYSFGYSGDTSSRQEVRDENGVIRGAMNYIDADGKLQSRSYIADELGFRVVASDLPVAPVDNSQPVQETAEVKAARAEHEALRTQKTISPDTKVRRKRAADPNFFYSTTALTNADTPANTFRAVPQVFQAHTFPLVPNYGFTTPVVRQNVDKKPNPTFYSTAVHVPVQYQFPYFGHQVFAAPNQVSQINHNPGYAVTYQI